MCARLTAVLVVLTLGSSQAVRGVSPLAQPGPVATPLWTVTEGMDGPESVYFDAASGFLFVSQIGGQAAERDGNGRISKLTVEGKLVDANWVSGLNAPKGLRAYQKTLWAADIDEVVGIDIATARITSRVKIAGATFLNDLATGPDGAVYTSDSFQNRIYIVRDGQASVLIESPSLELPNGVLVDGNRLIVATDGRPGPGGTPGRLFAVDLRTKSLTLIATGSIGTPDGVELDGRGGYIVSDVGGGRIFQVTAGGEVRLLRQLAPQTADIAFIPALGLLVVPHLGLNRVSAYDLSELKH